MKNGQDPLLVKPDRFIDMQTREPWVDACDRMAQTRGSHGCRLKEQDHFMSSSIKTSKQFVLVGQTW